MLATDAAPASVIPGLRSVLIVGSGDDDAEKWKAEGYRVVTLDIEPKCKPDIVASMTDMGDIGAYDAVWCCHALEHLYPHEVPKALREFKRVLKPGGTAVVVVPDLQDVQPTEDVLLVPECGPISGLHLYYGDPAQIVNFPYMAHHCGFVKDTLAGEMRRAGFSSVGVARAPYYNLIGTGVNA